LPFNAAVLEPADLPIVFICGRTPNRRRRLTIGLFNDRGGQTGRRTLAMALRTLRPLAAAVHDPDNAYRSARSHFARA
jgi:hypothetical protein